MQNAVKNDASGLQSAKLWNQIIYTVWKLVSCEGAQVYRIRDFLHPHKQLLIFRQKKNGIHCRLVCVVWQPSTAHRNMLDAAASVCSVAFLHSTQHGCQATHLDLETTSKW